MNRFLSIFVIIILINVYIILLFFFNIELFTASLEFIKSLLSPILGNSLYLVSVLGIVAVAIVAFFLLRISSKS
jgi:hypothetical protein